MGFTTLYTITRTMFVLTNSCISFEQLVLSVSVLADGNIILIPLITLNNFVKLIYGTSYAL